MANSKYNTYKRRFLSTNERLADMIEKSEGCWEWVGGKDPDGYGIFWCWGKSHRAPKFVWEWYNGKVKSGFVLHSCCNSSCVNPRHLYIGSQRDNAIDRIKDGNHWQVKLTPRIVLKIREQLDKTNKDLALEYGVAETTISAIRTGKSWAWVGR